MTYDTTPFSIRCEVGDPTASDISVTPGDQNWLQIQPLPDSTESTTEFRILNYQIRIASDTVHRLPSGRYFTIEQRLQLPVVETAPMFSKRVYLRFQIAAKRAVKRPLIPLPYGGFTKDQLRFMVTERDDQIARLRGTHSSQTVGGAPMPGSSTMTADGGASGVPSAGVGAGGEATSAYFNASRIGYGGGQSAYFGVGGASTGGGGSNIPTGGTAPGGGSATSAYFIPSGGGAGSAPNVASVYLGPE